MLAQASNAKGRLEAAGLKYRQDFTVRTERIVKPLTGFVGYGDAIIAINPTADTKAVSLIQAMREQRLSVWHYKGYEREWVQVEDDRKGQLFIVEIGKGTREVKP